MGAGIDSEVSLFELARAAVNAHDLKAANFGLDHEENALALARLGGQGGQAWVYKDSQEPFGMGCDQSSASFGAGSHRQWF